MNKSIKVGVFVLAALLLGGIATFLIGDNRELWDSKVHFKSAFGDVAGLRPGAPVRMGGVDVGTVGGVKHAEDVADQRIYVDIAVIHSEVGRIRQDTRAGIQNKGLLGDKMVELTTGGTGPNLAPGGMIETEEPVDFTAKLGAIANKAESAMSNVEGATRALDDPRFKENVQAAVEDLRLLLDGLARKDTAAHRLFLDPTEGQKIDQLITNANNATAQLDATLGSLREVAEHVKTGPGVAHALVYDGELSGHAAGAMAEVHKDLEAVRTGNGLVHSLIYGDTDTQHVMGNVNAMTDDLRDIVREIKQGKGTLGALLVDPSVYEDIKGLVGNVERNEVLRALVRYSIKSDDRNHPTPRVDAK